MDTAVFKLEPFEDNYEIGDDIGSGHFAVVRKCAHRQTGEAFAAKFIRKRRGGGRKGAKMEDIVKEINILRSIKHPNVISLHEVYDTKPEVILVLELVSGGELFEYISEKEALSEEEASAFIKQILEGVKHLHDNNIVHLDLKPENIMLLDQSSTKIKLIDFGLARRLTDKEDMRAMMGTAEFIAPEVVSYEPLSLATDMWSIGVITYILLSGSSPFLGDSQQETYHNITALNYDFDHDLFQNTSELAKDFIEKLFVRNPRKRATVDDCLNHAWIKPSEARETIARRSAMINIDNFKSFMARKRWKQSMRVVSLCNRLSRSIQLRKSTDTLSSRTTMSSRNTLDEEDKAENFVMAALFCASEEGNVDGLKELSEMANNIDLSTANKHGETAVHMAASGGHVDVLKFLQDKGVNINIKDKQGDTAMYWAARQGHLEAIKCLHEAGLCLDSQNKSAETALHVAARYGHAQVVDFLCSANANINVIDSLGETPLHSAAWHGYVSIVRTLCAHDAVLDMQNKEGETVLHCAAVRGNLDCIKILLDHGAPLNHLDKRGSTALHLACQRHHSGIALMLLRAGCEMDTIDKETGESALHAASREGLVDVVQTMCSLGCKVDTISADGFTPLHLAVKAGHIEIARCLLMSGAQPETPNKDGVTAEIIALAQGSMDIAELMSKVKGEKGQVLIQQLTNSPNGLSRIKLKVLGSTGVGKSLLIESLKCGFLGSFFRRRLPSSTGNSIKVKGKLSRQFSLPTPLNYSVANPTYTKGIEIQQATIAGAGDFSIWDFSGYEPYYMLYDHFLGDTNCLHLVTFSLQDTPDEQLAQVIFWLNFLKARVPPAMPIGYCGQLPNTPRVLLIATHADRAGCSRNSRGEYVSVDASTLHQKVQQMFRHDINLADRLYIVDAQVATSADMKALKHALGAEKRDIVSGLPKSNGLLEATVAQLPVWRRENHIYPVLTWPLFAEAIRSKVNPLASDDHIKLLVEQLQLMGEVVYLESETGPDLVVLSSRWLCVDIIGSLMSHEKISQARITGCFSMDEFQLMFPEIEAANLLHVLEALEVCTQCEVEGDVEFEFPCLNFIETLSGLWQKDDERYNDAVYGGVRLHTSFQSGAQLKYLFPRIQVFLRRNMLGESEEQEVDLYQWHHGSKYCWGQLEGLIDMDHNEQFLEIKVRGPPDSRYSLFFFLEDFVNVVEQVVENVCPGLCTERYTLSPSQLRQHGKIVRSYSPTELLRMQLENRSSVVLNGTTTEYFLDIACMGSEEVLQHLTLGMDLEVSHLTIHTQRLLSLLLDPADPMGRDWCLLAVTLGLSDYLPMLDNDDQKQVSQTQRVLAEWTRRCDATVRDLVMHLKDFNRIDAVEAILRTTPPCRTLTYEDQSTDESGGAHGTDASTNTLSNLSR